MPVRYWEPPEVVVNVGTIGHVDHGADEPMLTRFIENFRFIESPPTVEIVELPHLAKRTAARKSKRKNHPDRW